MSNKKSRKLRSRNKTGVTSVSLIANKGFRVEFRTHETGEEKVIAKTFTFGECKGVRPAFERAVKSRHSFEMGKFGKTNINLSKMDDYWKLVQKNYSTEKLKWL